MKANKRGGTKYPQTGGTGGNTPFAIQSRKKEWDNGHDNMIKQHEKGANFNKKISAGKLNWACQLKLQFDPQKIFYLFPLLGINRIQSLLSEG